MSKFLLIHFRKRAHARGERQGAGERKKESEADCALSAEPNAKLKPTSGRS